MVVAMIVVVSSTGEFRSTPIVVVFWLVVNNVFLRRQAAAGQTPRMPSLVAADMLFSDHVLPRDRVRLRLAKFRTLSVGAFIALIAYCIIALLSGTLTINGVTSAFLVLSAGLIIDAPTLFMPRGLPRRLHMVVKWSMLILWIIVQYRQQSFVALWIYSGALLVLYTPSWVAYYIQGRHDSGPEGHDMVLQPASSLHKGFSKHDSPDSMISGL